MKKLIFHHVTYIKNSGCGPSPTHIAVMNEFRRSIEDGKRYCQARGWEVILSRGVLNVTSKAPFGFCMTALVQEAE